MSEAKSGGSRVDKASAKQSDRKRTWIIVLLLVLIAVCVVLLLRSCTNTPVTPDYPPQGTEDNQTPIDGDTTDKIDSPEGGGAINVTYMTDVTVSLSAETVTLYYANPNASNQNVAILLMIDDLVVAKSDLITPGHEVKTLTLEKYAKSVLQEGGYDAQLLVRAYSPDSGEKAMIDTTGVVTVQVVK